MKSVKVTEVPEGAQLIDVREPDEFTEVRATGAVNIPLSSLPESTDRINPDRDIYVICRSGGRSAKAAEYLESSLGWDNVINVDGGTMAWVDADRPHQHG